MDDSTVGFYIPSKKIIQGNGRPTLPVTHSTANSSNPMQPSISCNNGRAVCTGGAGLHDKPTSLLARFNGYLSSMAPDRSRQSLDHAALRLCSQSLLGKAHAIMQGNVR